MCTRRKNRRLKAGNKRQVGFGGNGKSVLGQLGRPGRALVIQCSVAGSQQFALSFNPLWFVKITGWILSHDSVSCGQGTLHVFEPLERGCTS